MGIYVEDVVVNKALSCTPRTFHDPRCILDVMDRFNIPRKQTRYFLSSLDRRITSNGNMVSMAGSDFRYRFASILLL